MDKSSIAVEEMRQTLCRENDETMEMLAEATRKMLQLEQEKSIAMANLAFIKEEFQRYANTSQKKPMKKQNTLSPKGGPMSTEGGAGDSKVEEDDDEEEDQDLEEMVEELRATVQSLEAEKE